MITLLTDRAASHPGRLAALDALAILDTAAEPGFDDVVRLATRLCATPVALVSLVAADRQWFKARVGFPACETDLDRSVCKFALSADDLLSIPDLAADPRTAANPLVTGEPHIRFYVGAPLRLSDGNVVGSLCVIDTVPRPEGLNPEQADDLRALARQVVALLELRGALHARDAAAATERQLVEDLHVAQETLRVSEERLSLAFEASGSLGWWDWDIPNDRLYAGEDFARIYGLDPALAAAGAPFGAFVDGIHPEDRDWVGERIRQAVETAGEFAEEYRLLATDGTVTWVHARGRCYHDSAGQPLRYPGVATDVTDAKHAGLRQNALLKLGDRLRDLDTVGALVQAAAETMADVLGASRAGYGLVNPADETVEVPTDWCAPTVGSIAGNHGFREYGSHVDDLKRGEIVLVEDVEHDPRSRATADRYLAIGIRTMINVPVMERGRLVGIGFVHYGRKRSFRPEELAFVRTVTDLVQVAVARVQAERQRELLNGELSHRLKNTLAMVQGIAGQTLRVVSDQAPVQAFTERLIALSRAHDVLMQDSWAAAPVRSVVEKVLSLQTSLDRFRIEGPGLALAPQATLSLSLLLHELTTNAVKYGALSVEGGVVHVTWGIEERAERTVVLAWREHGGPPAAAPAKRGFGTRLIQTGLVGTRDTRLDYLVTGLDAEFRAPISQVVAL